MPARSRRETPRGSFTRNAPSAAVRARAATRSRAPVRIARATTKTGVPAAAPATVPATRPPPPRRRVRWRLRVPRKRSVTGVVARVTAGSQPGDWLRVVISTGP